MIRLDFIERLADKIEEVIPKELGQVNIGQVKDMPSIGLLPQPSGLEEKVFFDGSRNKPYSFNVMMKHKDDMLCNDVLTYIYRMIENLTDLPSLNDSYTFESSRTANLPNKVGFDEKGLSVWVIDIEIEIQIKRGVEI